MKHDDDYRNQFDRFAQDRYLKLLLKTDPDSIIPTLFLDLMNCVNMIQGQGGLILAETENTVENQQPMDAELVEEITVRVMGQAVDMSNILKALMEYYEITHNNADLPPSDDEPST